MAQARLIFAIIVITILLFFSGFLIGYFTAPEKKAENDDVQTGEDSRFQAHQKLYDSLKAESIRQYLRQFTDKPHVAGSHIQLEFGRKIAEEWTGYKTFDKVETFPYNVLLSYLKNGETNVVQAFNSSDHLLFEFKGREKVLEASENHSAVIPPLLGYAKPGNAKGKLLYVNYGRQEDFVQLLSVSGLKNCSGYLAIMRYGKIYRGNKINNAANFGAAGAILYNDPADSAPFGEKQTYPNTWWLPPSGVQRGNLRTVKGDPLTPELPAIDGIMRMAVEDVFMPAIPATPLPYGQAKELLKLIEGMPAPSSWRGGFDFPYNIGVHGRSPIVKIQVNAKLSNRNITNIVGTILGKEEPDRWVLVGSHRDAWGFGAVDSSSGTAVMMEIAHGLKQLIESGWRPRRTIKLCSWGAEEQGLIGSTEWVEQQSKIVRDRAVAYINIDAVVRGNHSLSAKGSPLLKEVMFEETKKVIDESKSGKTTLYTGWRKGKKYPKFGSLGSGSDFVPFYQFIGVPSIAFDYSFNSDNVTIYPVYHSIHDTFNWMETFVDPNFLIHLSTCKLTARLLLRMTDSDHFPADVRSYGDALIRSMNIFRVNFERNLTNAGISVHHIDEAIREFNETAHAFEERRKLSKSRDFARLRILNNQALNLEKIFINPYGLPGRPDIRNIVFAPSLYNSYGSSSFPGISDELGKTQVNWKEVKKQINILYKSVKEANEFLKPV